MAYDKNQRFKICAFVLLISIFWRFFTPWYSFSLYISLSVFNRTSLTLLIVQMYDSYQLIFSVQILQWNTVLFCFVLFCQCHCLFLKKFHRNVWPFNIWFDFIKLFGKDKPHVNCWICILKWILNDFYVWKKK